jgi:hypothetical protein
MFEVITQANPLDTQSLEILKDAYGKLGCREESLKVSRRLASVHMDNGEYSSALLEYEYLLQAAPDDAGIIAALGEVEARLHAAEQSSNITGAVGIPLDYRGQGIENPSQLIATKKTAVKTHGEDANTLRARLYASDDGNEALAKFLVQNQLAPEQAVQQALSAVRKKNSERTQTDPARSLIQELEGDEMSDRQALMCGILDRTKFAYIPLECYEIDRQIVRMLPDEMILSRLIVPFDVVSRTCMIALANPLDATGKEAVQQLLDYAIQWHLACPEAIQKVISDTLKG